MKKVLVIATLGVAGLISAKNSEAKLNSLDLSNLSVVKIEKSTKNLGELKWHYLYQSTCGWTFNMTSDIAIQNMTDEQYENYIDEVITMNNQICKLHGEKPVNNFTFIKMMNTSGVKERV
ncbi:hypothetical protein HNP38_000922 [Chryseobacterium defluvii]|uniref:Uncharacterized protein n=1 Tax=Chryseobacterium defluvii TaxID=160396 RepID=A0A840KDN3_9FLAO|nr:hypothetical protein [Chryseobacterium defluvii]MBB4805650.1 hypothetical protein [Chryseobacterium defluvii]